MEPNRGGNATECLARIGILCRQDNDTERSDGASDRSVLRLCFSTLRRFPAYTAPFRTIIGFQVCRVDIDFYDRFYEPETVPDSDGPARNKPS
jgi:hypothetical protein